MKIECEVPFKVILIRILDIELKESDDEDAIIAARRERLAKAKLLKEQEEHARLNQVSEGTE